MLNSAAELAARSEKPIWASNRRFAASFGQECCGGENRECNVRNLQLVLAAVLVFLFRHTVQPAWLLGYCRGYSQTDAHNQSIRTASSLGRGSNIPESYFYVQRERGRGGNWRSLFAPSSSLLFPHYIGKKTLLVIQP